MTIRTAKIIAFIVCLPMLVGSGTHGKTAHELKYPDRRLMVRIVIEGLDLWSERAEELVLRTGAVESLYLFRQGMNEAPERGFWQIHPQTASDIMFRYLKRPSKKDYRDRIERLLNYPLEILESDPDLLESELRDNDILGVALCRLWYVMSPYRIPSAQNLKAQARLWKRWFNTHKGTGTEQYFVSTVKQLGV